MCCLKFILPNYVPNSGTTLPSPHHEPLCDSVPSCWNAVPSLVTWLTHTVPCSFVSYPTVPRKSSLSDPRPSQAVSVLHQLQWSLSLQPQNSLLCVTVTSVCHCLPNYTLAFVKALARDHCCISSPKDGTRYTEVLNKYSLSKWKLRHDWLFPQWLIRWLQQS